MRILVTGGAGFIGSHASEALLGLGHQLCILDDLNDSYSPQLKRENLTAIGDSSRFIFVHADIRDEKAVNRAFAQFAPEAVLHLAARPGVRASIDNPLLFEDVNVRGSLVVLEACRAHGVSRVVAASSSSVYGDAERASFREDDPVGRPISPYAATKLALEQLCYTYSHLYNISIVCLRLFTVYGPRQRPDLAIRRFMEAALAGKPISMFGDGSTSRDYTYVSDVVAGIVAAFDVPSPYEIINIGNSSPVSLASLIAAIETAVARPMIIKRLPAQPGDVQHTCANVQKARRLLNYQPRVSLEEGLRRNAEWLMPLELASAATSMS